MVLFNPYLIKGFINYIKEMKRFIGVLAALFVLPLFASAQLGEIGNLVGQIGSIIDLLLPIVVAIALLAFFWGLAKFIFAAGDESAKEQGKRIMIWGIVALFVIVSVWGLVNFLGDATGVGQDTLDQVPTVPGI
jgi:hypothetical protein